MARENTFGPIQLFADQSERMICCFLLNTIGMHNAVTCFSIAPHSHTFSRAKLESSRWKVLSILCLRNLGLVLVMCCWFTTLIVRILYNSHSIKGNRLFVHPFHNYGVRAKYMSCKSQKRSTTS